MNLDFTKDEWMRIANVATHVVLFLQMLTWTLHTRHEDYKLKVVRLLWAGLTLLMALVTWKYYWLFSYAVLHVIWQVTISIHILLIKQLSEKLNCDKCPRRK